MAKLPDATTLGERSKIDLPSIAKSTSATSAGNPLAKANIELAATVQGIAAGFQERQDRMDASRAESTFLQRQAEADNSFEGDPDYGTYQPRYAEQMQQVRDEASQMIRHRGQREEFVLKADQSIAIGTAKIQQQARKTEVDIGRARLVEILGSNRESALRATNPAVRMGLIEASHREFDIAVQNGYMGQEEAAAQSQVWVQDFSASAIGMMEPAERIQALQQITDGNPETLADYVPSDVRIKMTRAAEDEMRVAANRKGSELKVMLDDAKKALSEGFTPPYLAQLQETVKGTELEGQVAEMVVDADVANAFSRMPPRQQEVLLTNERAKKVKTGRDVDLLKRMERIHERIITELKAGEGLKVAMNNGTVGPLGHLDFSDPEALIVELKNRRISADVSESDLGHAVPPFLPSEAAELGEAMDRAPDKQKLAILAMLADPEGLGPKAIDVMALLDSKQYRQYATAGEAIIEGDIDTAEMIIKGLSQAKANPQMMPSAQELNSGFSDILRGTLYANPSVRERMNLSAKAVYAQMSAQEHDFSGKYSADRAAHAIQQVTGGTVSWSGSNWGAPTSRVRAPARGMTQSYFQRWMDSIDAADIEQNGGVYGATPEQAIEFIRKSGRLMEVDRGEYLIFIDGMPLHKQRSESGRAEAFVLRYDPDKALPESRTLFERSGGLTGAALDKAREYMEYKNR